MTLPPSSISVTTCTQCFFTAGGVSMLWDDTRVSLVEVGVKRGEERTLQDITFAGESIVDVATFDDNLFIATSVGLHKQWTRPWQRRETVISSDRYLYEHELCEYRVRAFSISQKMQIGATLTVAQQGVNATIRAGPGRVVVQIIGHQCVASVWRAPNNGDATWEQLYSELTWDPDTFAKLLGFADAEEELVHYRSVVDDTDIKRERGYLSETAADTQTLDYAFLSATLLVRLVERTDVDDVYFSLEIFEVVDGGPCNLLEFSVPGKGGRLELSEGTLTTESTFSADHGRLSIWNTNAGNSFHAILDVRALLECARNPASIASATDPFSLFCLHALDSDAPFTGYALTGYRPSIAKNTILFPVLDLDPTSARPDAPIIRFVRLDKGGRSIDVVVESMISTDDLLLGFKASEGYSGLEPPWLVSWDGRDTVCLVFRCPMSLRWAPEDKPSPRVWYAKLPPEILAAIGGD
ncbi:hypothetical protein C8R46DRAFT_1309313 [Mycena filopes]|nr:hypothetical protein C8R46DRAFT_1309313 [Mycena filopes]